MRDTEKVTVGVLALQGAFREHIKAIKRIGYNTLEVRTVGQLKEIDGLIIPGGESTAINKLLVKYGFREALDNFYKSSKPIFGTCAGLIILSKKSTNNKFGLGYIDIVVDRNAYGRQIDSFESYIDLKKGLDLNGSEIHAVFIRAPKIKEIGSKVEELGRYKSEVVLAREGNVLVCAFHPELTEDLRIHKYFIDMIRESKYYKNS
jgi:pyridoxal 5'-phosphate synthase pdxT subunit